jgi:hypothetical protein
MSGQHSYALIILLVTCPENWRANIPITIQCSTVRPGFASNLELKACKVDPGVHRLLAYLVWAISNGGGLDLEVTPSDRGDIIVVRRPEHRISKEIDVFVLQTLRIP